MMNAIAEVLRQTSREVLSFVVAVLMFLLGIRRVRRRRSAVRPCALRAHRIYLVVPVGRMSCHESSSGVTRVSACGSDLPASIYARCRLRLRRFLLGDAE